MDWGGLLPRQAQGDEDSGHLRLRVSAHIRVQRDFLCVVPVIDQGIVYDTWVLFWFASQLWWGSAFCAPEFSHFFAGITCGFIQLAPYGSDVLIISLSDNHLYPGPNINLFYNVASHPPAQSALLISGEPQVSFQELFIPNIITNTCRSYISLV